MKKQIKGILVVEGKSDVAFLTNYIDAEFVITNGSDIPFETINYLKEMSKSKDIIVLTDPDFPGKKIRDTLDKEIPNLKHVFIDKDRAIKHHKVGVAEADIDMVLDALNHLYENRDPLGTISMSDLYELGLIGKDDSFFKRKIASEKLHLGFCNAKTFLKRINTSNISIEELKEALK